MSRETPDHALLDQRDRDLVDGELPRVIDGARRGRLIARDPVSTTWEAFCLETGVRLWLRCLRPRWRDDAAVRRRLCHGEAPGGPRPRFQGGGDWPHLRWTRPGTPLADLLPVDEPMPLATRVGILARGLQGLHQLHERGLCLGEPVEQVLVLANDGPRLRWRDPFAAGGAPEDDLKGLARVVLELSPSASDPVAHLCLAWVDHPPLRAADAEALVRQAMAASLLRQRHALALVARNTERRRRLGRLARAVNRLETVLPPPRLRCCVRAEHFAGLLVVESDGERVVTGAVDSPGAPLDREVWSAARGLEAMGNRQLLRAWNRRRSGDEERRLEAQAALGSSDEHTVLLMRWLSAMSRLRSARMLLEVDGRVG